jgi:hypothetical protein
MNNNMQLTINDNELMPLPMPQLMAMQAKGFRFLISDDCWIGPIKQDGENYLCSFMDDRGSMGDLKGYAETKLCFRFVELKEEVAA